MTKHCSWNEDLKRQRDQREWERALAKKEEGHEYFKERKYDQAIDCYEEAKIMCPAENKKELSTFFLDGAEAIIDENLKTGEMIIEECKTALEQNELLKVLERLSTTREHNREMRNALESVTWMCLLEGFSNDQPTANAERITKKINKSMTTLDIAVRFVTESIHSDAEDSNKASTLSSISETPERTYFQGSVSKAVITATNGILSLDHAQFHNYKTEEALVDKRDRKKKEEQDNKAETCKLEKLLEPSLPMIYPLVTSFRYLSRSNTSERTSLKGSVNEPVMNDVKAKEVQCQVQNCETEKAWVDKSDRKKKEEQRNKAETEKLKELESVFEILSKDIYGDFEYFQTPIASYGEPDQDGYYQTQGLTEKRFKYIVSEARRNLKQVAKVELQKDEILDVRRFLSKTKDSILLAAVKLWDIASCGKPDQDGNYQIQGLKEKRVRNIG